MYIPIFVSIFVFMDIQDKRDIIKESGKLCLDLGKLVFAGLIIAGLVKMDFEAGSLIYIGIVAVAVLFFTGFMFLILATKKKGK